MDATDADRDSRRYRRLPPDGRDRIADEWGDIIYFCVKCDEECRGRGDYIRCPRYPHEHDRSGYMGTGTSYPEAVRRLAKEIATE